MRAEAALGSHPVAPYVSPSAELHVGSVDDGEVYFYGSHHSGILKEKSFRSKSKKSGDIAKTSVTA